MALSAPLAFAGEKPDDKAPREKPTAHVTVVKKVVPLSTTGEDVTGAAPAAGWAFTGTSATPGVEGLPATLTTGDDGAVTFDVTFPSDMSSVDLTVAETQQAGYELVTQGGADAVCVDTEKGHAVPVVDDDSVPGRPAFRLDLAKKQKVTCVVYNRPVKAEVTVEKQWVINDQTYGNGSRPAGFDAVLTLTGPGDAGPTAQSWGIARGGYREGETVTIDETIAIADPACTLDARRVTAANGVAVDAALPYSAALARGANTFTVTNRITCPTPPPPPPPPPAPPPAAPPTPSARPAPVGEVLGEVRQGRPRLGIEKRASRRSVVAGETVRFTIVVRNTGNAVARGLRVCDRLPRDVTVVDSNGGRMVAGGRVCWRIRRLGAGASTRRVLVVRVDRDASPGTIVNRATVRGEGQRRGARRRVTVRQPGPGMGVGGVLVTG
ncbi:DUF11 domain-containing protein [Conexibacter woesei]|nr:DUF11 domain-containing protein [Conexibacter woesei]